MVFKFFASAILAGYAVAPASAQTSEAPVMVGAAQVETVARKQELPASLGTSDRQTALSPHPGMVLTFDYEPARDGLALLEGGPTNQGYAADAVAHPTHIWQPRYIPQGTDPRGGSDIYSGQYQFNVDPEYAWTNGFTPFSLDRLGDLIVHAQLAGTVRPAFAAGELAQNPATGSPYNYVSGLLSSKNRFSQQGGYFEFTAKVPTGNALWPAFWLMPMLENHPPELDIMEVVGGYDPQSMYRTTSIAVSGAVQTHVPTGLNIVSRFHTYGVAWNDTTITQLFDGVPVATRSIVDSPEFGQPFYILMSLQVGSTLQQWVPAPNALTPTAADIIVRSVKVWQWPGPVGVNLSASSYLDSLASGGLVATISATNFGSSLSETFTKLSDPDNMFTISGNQLMLTNVVPAAVNCSHQVVIQVKDSLGRTRQRLFNVGVVTSTPLQANYVANQDLTSDFWTQNGVTVPGPTTVQEAPTAGVHQFGDAGGLPRPAGVQTYNAWLDAKAAPNRSELYLQVFDSDYDSQAYAFCNLSTGVVDYAATTGAFSNSAAFLTPLASGYYRCGFKFTTDAQSTGFHIVSGTSIGDSGLSYQGTAGTQVQITNLWLYNLNSAAGGY